VISNEKNLCYNKKMVRFKSPYTLGKKMITKEKVRNQVKSRFYYIFWGIATFSVVAGQLYVGSGYRIFANSLLRIFDAVEVEVGRDYDGRRYY
tara:strand:- start:9 stop:287 length:279 start_codon:yes stop_codon:yes gene_type:complete